MTPMSIRLTSRLFTIVAGAIVTGVGGTLAASPSPGESWLDQPRPATWNHPGLAIPKPPSLQTPEDPRCQAGVRPPQLEEDDALREAGWKLVGEYRGGWQILLIRAAAGHDGMCRPLGYQEFVFFQGKFAGTLSPAVMDSRTDGALRRTFIESASRVRAEYVRYGASDPLCCPSRTTTVVFEMIATEPPVIRPVSATTAATDGANVRR